MTINKYKFPEPTIYERNDEVRLTFFEGTTRVFSGYSENSDGEYYEWGVHYPAPDDKYCRVVRGTKQEIIDSLIKSTEESIVDKVSWCEDYIKRVEKYKE